MTVEVDDDIWYQLSMDTPTYCVEVDKDWHGGIELEVKNIEKSLKIKYKFHEEKLLVLITDGFFC